jgi:nucleoside-diphosphate-sugar epimerase
MKNILITGNMGYIGPSVAKQLRFSSPKVNIMGIDMGYFAHCLSNIEVFPECNVNIQYFGDLRELPRTALQNVDGIVHLSAISNDPMGNKFEKPTHEINYQASIDLAQKARESGVKSFVFASSCSVYGFADDQPRTEQSALNPLTPYAKSKIMTETALGQMASDRFKVTCLRFATACGMSERLRLDLVLNDFVASAIVSGEIVVLSDGTPWRPLINIRDMARAIDWALMRDPALGGNFLVINSGSDAWNYQVKDLAETVAAVLPGTEISINQNAPPDKRSYRVSFDLFKKLVPEKYHPQVGLQETVEELRQGLVSMGFQDKNFRESQFIRLKVLNNHVAKGLLNENLQWQFSH